MSHHRVIPLLMLHKEELYNSTQFGSFRYIGDPLIAVKIFNEKEAQEICLVDIDPSRENKPINFSLLQDIAGECFMPLSYGGGIRSLNDAQQIIYSGFEKIVVNSAAFHQPNLIGELVKELGSSTIVLSLDYKMTPKGRTVHVDGGKTNTGKSVLEWIQLHQDIGVGEILLNNMDLDGMQTGQDLPFLQSLTPHLTTSCISVGGIGNLSDIQQVLKTGIDSVAASSLFVYKGNLNAVLINYPDQQIIENLVEKTL